MITKEHAILLARLAELRRQQGELSLRKIAEDTGGLISHGTVFEVLKGARLPRWKTVATLVSALGGEPQAFYQFWEDAWLARPDSREAEEKLGLDLAANLDLLLTGMAGTTGQNLYLIAYCRRCRNSLLYLMRPGGIGLERVIQSRLRALHITHEGHGDDQSFDDAVPQFT